MSGLQDDFTAASNSGALHALAQTVDTNESAALRDWVASLEPGVAAEFGFRAESFGTALALAAPAVDTVFLNRVIGLGVLQEPSRALVRDVADFYRDLGARFMVHVRRHDPHRDLSDWLGEEGLEPEGEWITLHRDARPAAAPSTDLRTERVRASQATVFAETLCTGYGMPDEWTPLYEGLVGRPGWQHYMAWDGDLAVATASVFLHGRYAWCGNSGTLRRYRQRGAHRALSRLRLSDAMDAGCSLFTGETWQQQRRRNQSLRNHIRDGWQEAYRRINYTSVDE